MYHKFLKTTFALWFDWTWQIYFKTACLLACHLWFVFSINCSWPETSSTLLLTMREDNIKRKDLFRVLTLTSWMWSAQVNSISTGYSCSPPNGVITCMRHMNRFTESLMQVVLSHCLSDIDQLLLSWICSHLTASYYIHDIQWCKVTKCIYSDTEFKFNYVVFLL